MYPSFQNDLSSNYWLPKNDELPISLEILLSKQEAEHQQRILDIRNTKARNPIGLFEGEKSLTDGNDPLEYQNEEEEQEEQEDQGEIVPVFGDLEDSHEEEEEGITENNLDRSFYQNQSGEIIQEDLIDDFEPPIDEQQLEVDISMEIGD